MRAELKSNLTKKPISKAPKEVCAAILWFLFIKALDKVVIGVIWLLIYVLI